MVKKLLKQMDQESKDLAIDILSAINSIRDTPDKYDNVNAACIDMLNKFNGALLDNIRDGRAYYDEEKNQYEFYISIHKDTAGWLEFNGKMIFKVLNSALKKFSFTTNLSQDIYKRIAEGEYVMFYAKRK